MITLALAFVCRVAGGYNGFWILAAICADAYWMGSVGKAVVEAIAR